MTGNRTKLHSNLNPLKLPIQLHLLTLKMDFGKTESPTQDPDWWTFIRFYPFQILDQNFGVEISEEAMKPQERHDSIFSKQLDDSYFESSGFSEVHATDRDDFSVRLSTSQFRPHELKVRIEGGFLKISGESAERLEGCGSTWRKFTRRYMLPRNCDFGDASCIWEGDVLSVKVPKVEKVPKLDVAIVCKSSTDVDHVIV